MIAIITGGRQFHAVVMLTAALDAFHRKHTIIEFVDGVAKGADELGYKWALRRGVDSKRFPARWRLPNGKTDRSAGHRRNARMLKYAQGEAVRRDCKVVVLAFEGGKGTAGMKRLAMRAGVRVFEASERRWVLFPPMACGWCDAPHYGGPEQCDRGAQESWWLTGKSE